MNALLKVVAGLRHPPDDEQLSEYELEMTIRNRLYGERGASLDVKPVHYHRRRTRARVTVLER